MRHHNLPEQVAGLLHCAMRAGTVPDGLPAERRLQGLNIPIVNRSRRMTTLQFHSVGTFAAYVNHESEPISAWVNTYTRWVRNLLNPALSDRGA